MCLACFQVRACWLFCHLYHGPGSPSGLRQLLESFPSLSTKPWLWGVVEAHALKYNCQRNFVKKCPTWQVRPDTVVLKYPSYVAPLGSKSASKHLVVSTQPGPGGQREEYIVFVLFCKVCNSLVLKCAIFEFCKVLPLFWWTNLLKTLPEAQRTQGIESNQIKSFGQQSKDEIKLFTFYMISIYCS